MQLTQGGCWGPPRHLQHQIGQAWTGSIPATPSPRDSRSASLPALREVYGEEVWLSSGLGVVQVSPSGAVVAAGQVPTDTSNPQEQLWCGASLCQHPIPAQESPACDLPGQPVTTSSSPIWTYGCLAPKPPRQVPLLAGPACEPICSLCLSWLCSPGSLSRSGPVQSSL